MYMIHNWIKNLFGWVCRCGLFIYFYTLISLKIIIIKYIYIYTFVFVFDCFSLKHTKRNQNKWFKRLIMIYKWNNNFIFKKKTFAQQIFLVICFSYFLMMMMMIIWFRYQKYTNKVLRLITINMYIFYIHQF